MRATHRSRGIGALVVVLAVLAIVLARSVLLAGAALVGGWLLARQALFVRDCTRTVRSLSVTQSPAETGLRTGDETPVTLAARLSEPVPVSVEVESGLPTAATAAEALRIEIEPPAAAGSRTVDVSWPVTGRHRFDDATVTVTDTFFERTWSVAGAPTVTVEPRWPRDVHVGRGGDRVATVHGEHRIEGIGSGLEPAEIREYVPGDRADRIDWKATARRGTPHVREYETQTTRRTLLVVDHRRSLATGPPDETKLDYLREVALAIVSSARHLGDPVGLLTVGDAGVTSHRAPATKPDHYAAVRRRLLELEPTTGRESAAGAGPTAAGAAAVGGGSTEAGAAAVGDESTVAGAAGADDGSTPTGAAAPRAESIAGASRVSSSAGGRSAIDPAARLRRGAPGGRSPPLELDGDDALSTTLRPLASDRQSYETRIEHDPLFGGVRTAVATERDGLWTVVLTDDTRPVEVRETVALSRSNGNAVTVLFAPTVLYEPGGLADVERAYDRYSTFEELRRGLARTDRVTALEVGPGDRLSAVLAGARSSGGRG